VSQYQKGKTNLDFTETTDSGWQWHQLGHMQVCTSLQTDNHASTPPLWMMSNRLQHNPSKTDMLWCSSARRQHQIPTGPARVGDTPVQPVRTVRDLGVYIDADVTMSAHVTAVVKACFAALRQICSVCRSLTRTTLLTLVHALVVTKGGLLQLSSLGYFQTTVTTAAVCLQCRCSTRVLRKEVRAHNSTSP